MNRLLLFIFVFPFFLSAQDRTIDSLKLALKNAKHDTTRVILYTRIGDLCELDEISFYAESCIKLCEKGLSSSHSKQLTSFYLSFKSSAINNLGYLEQQKGNTFKALEYYEKSLKIQGKINDKNGTALALNNMGVVYMNLGDRKSVV